MMKSIVAAALGAACLSYAGVACAKDFPATPLQHGAPTDLPGERMIPGMSQTMGMMNTAMTPMMQTTSAAASAPMAKKHMMMHRHHMMKKKMMRKTM